MIAAASGFLSMALPLALIALAIVVVIALGAYELRRDRRPIQRPEPDVDWRDLIPPHYRLPRHRS